MRTFSILILIFSLKLVAQPTFSGAHFFGSYSASCYDMLVKHDKNNQMYTCGAFYGDIDFNMAAPPVTFTQNGLFVCKYGEYNNLLWARCLASGNNNNNIDYMKIDKEGSVIIMGRFNQMVDFDPGPAMANLYGGYTYNNYLTWDIFLCKLDSNGNFVWVRQYGSEPMEMACGLDIDMHNNIYISGTFRDSIDLDPGQNVLYGKSGARGSAMFLQKLNADGEMLWSKVMPVQAYSRATALVVNESYGVTLGGYFHSDIDFNPGTTTDTLSTGTENCSFVARYDTAGNFKWAKKFAKGAVNSLVSDKAGNIYCSGYFTSGDFDPGPGTFSATPAGQSDAYITKWDPAGNFIWLKTFGGVKFDYASYLEIDADNNLYCAGICSDSTDLDPGLGASAVNLNLVSTTVPFVNKFNESGDFVCGGYINSTVSTWPSGFSIDNVGNMYIAGMLNDSSDVDMGPQIYPLALNGRQGSFISKSNCGLTFTGIQDVSVKKEELEIYPNPSSSYINIITESQKDRKVTIYNSFGMIVITKARISNNEILEIGNLPPAIYLVELNAGDRMYRTKFIKQD